MRSKKEKKLHHIHNKVSSRSSYYIADKGEESDYEDEQGTHYFFQKEIGKGANANARIFSTKNTINRNRVVLSPRPKDFFWSYREIQAKVAFFQAIYPTLPQAYFEGEKKGEKPSTYRLVLPLLPGTPFHKSVINNNTLPQMMLAAVRALIDCHQKGYVFIDLKADNILYDEFTQTAFLIDGGTSKKIGETVPEMFQVNNLKQLIENKKNYAHMAPECWYFKPTLVFAHTSMDVYSLGKMISDLFASAPIQKDIQCLLDNCLKENPDERMSLIDLLNQLNIILANDERGVSADNIISEKMQSTPATICQTKPTAIELSNQPGHSSPKSYMDVSSEEVKKIPELEFYGKRKRQESQTYPKKRIKVNVDDNLNFFPSNQLVSTENLDLPSIESHLKMIK